MSLCWLKDGETNLGVLIIPSILFNIQAVREISPGESPEDHIDFNWAPRYCFPNLWK